jgi:hypothetical protein
MARARWQAAARRNGSASGSASNTRSRRWRVRRGRAAHDLQSRGFGPFRYSRLPFLGKLITSYAWVTEPYTAELERLRMEASFSAFVERRLRTMTPGELREYERLMRIPKAPTQ